AHELSELLWIERLSAIRKGFVRAVMDLNQQPVRARCDGGAPHGRNLFPAAGSVRWVGKDREVRKFFYNRYGRNIHRVARVSLKGAHAALTYDDVIVAACHQLLGGKQKLFNGRSNA